jgi:hypothetical protein
MDTDEKLAISIIVIIISGGIMCALYIFIRNYIYINYHVPTNNSNTYLSV